MHRGHASEREQVQGPPDFGSMHHPEAACRCRPWQRVRGARVQKPTLLVQPEPTTCP